MAAQKAQKPMARSIEEAIRNGESRQAVYLATMKAARLLDATESARDARPLYSCVMEGIERPGSDEGGESAEAGEPQRGSATDGPRRVRPAQGSRTGAHEAGSAGIESATYRGICAGKCRLFQPSRWKIISRAGPLWPMPISEPGGNPQVARDRIAEEMQQRGGHEVPRQR
jgi:hypothetical protein